MILGGVNLSDFIKYSLERSKTKQIHVMTDTLQQYELYLKINDQYTINQLIVLIRDYSKNNTAWLPSLFEATISLDIQFSYCMNSLNSLSELVLPELTATCLGFNREQLKKVFLFKSRVSTEKAVTEDTILSIGNRTETLLKKDSIDYRFLRLFCITTVLGLLNSACLLSFFGLHQFQLYDSDFHVG